MHIIIKKLQHGVTNRLFMLQKTSYYCRPSMAIRATFVTTNSSIQGDIYVGWASE